MTVRFELLQIFSPDSVGKSKTPRRVKSVRTHCRDGTMEACVVSYLALKQHFIDLYLPKKDEVAHRDEDYAM